MHLDGRHTQKVIKMMIPRLLAKPSRTAADSLAGADIEASVGADEDALTVSSATSCPPHSTTL